MYKYKHSVYVDKKMWWINTADFQQQTILLDTESPTTKRNRLSGIPVLPTSKQQEIARKDFASIRVSVTERYSKYCTH